MTEMSKPSLTLAPWHGERSVHAASLACSSNHSLICAGATARVPLRCSQRYTPKLSESRVSLVNSTASAMLTTRDVFAFPPKESCSDCQTVRSCLPSSTCMGGNKSNFARGLAEAHMGISMSAMLKVELAGISPINPGATEECPFPCCCSS